MICKAFHRSDEDGMNDWMEGRMANNYIFKQAVAAGDRVIIFMSSTV